MAQKFPRSPYDQTGGLVYFARMLDKIRLHAAGELPEAYQKHLGRDFDGRCLKLLGVTYEALKERVLGGFTDSQALEWCQQAGRELDADAIEVWNGFMIKRGWRDEASDRIVFRLKEAGLEHLDKQAVTMFDFIDLDEGRTPPDFSHWEPPRIAQG
jgi:gluconokinase